MMKGQLPRTVSGPVLAELFSLTPRRIRALADEGVIIRAKRRGQYDLIQSVHRYLDLVKGQSEGASLTGQRTRLVTLQADLAQVELSRARGDLYRELKRAIESFIVVTRTLLLDVAGKLAPRLAIAMTPQATFKLVDDEVRATLTRLAQWDRWDPETGLPVIEVDDEETNANEAATGNTGAERTDSAVAANGSLRAGAATSSKEG
jgi:phage terminase Nu1 subunit (DNA packaging protein)